LWQFNFKQKLINNSTAIGIRCKDGVVLGVEKLIISKMLEHGSNKRIFSVDRHCGLVSNFYLMILVLFF
jgi:20S proteasome subunit alpha 7